MNESNDNKGFKKNKSYTSNQTGITVKNSNKFNKFNNFNNFNKPNKFNNQPDKKFEQKFEPKKDDSVKKFATPENKNPVQPPPKITKPFKQFNNFNKSNQFNQFKNNKKDPKYENRSYNSAADKINKIDKADKQDNIFNEKIYSEIETAYQPDEINEISADYLSLKIPEESETGPKIEIVGVRFKPVGRIYFFSPGGLTFSANDKIIVETSRGLELGFIVIPNKNISESKVVQPLKSILRKASNEDAERAERNKILAKDTIKAANDRIKFHKLNSMKMKLIEAEYTFDNSKLRYYFTADGRVDFRELVKDLASIFRTRIEMRQIGIRDQTKLLGGLSICGRPFCCNAFLQDFAQVTIKMAKEQNMSINSSKISGACGRLMCCLKYEHEAYEYLSKDTPKVNSIVEASTGETGVVVDSNILTGICKVKINPKNNAESDNTLKSFPKKNLKVIGFIKNEHERLYGKDKETETEIEIEEEENNDSVKEI